MSFISVFDVLGPNMIGPSSSHTAGAAKIAYLAQKMITGPLIRVDFTLYGSFARTYRGHGTDRALLGGMMGFTTDDMRIRMSTLLLCVCSGKERATLPIRLWSPTVIFRKISGKQHWEDVPPHLPYAVAAMDAADQEKGTEFIQRSICCMVQISCSWLIIIA